MIKQQHKFHNILPITYHMSSHILLVLHLCQLERVLLGPEHLSAVLDSGSVWLQNSILPHLRVLVSLPLCEAPLRRHQNLLSSWELELCTSECLDSTGLLVVLHPHRQERLSNLHSSHCSLGLTKGTSHSSLEPIGPGTAQHFVNSDHVKRCTLTRMWKASFPTFFTMYLLAQILAASNASPESCSNSSEMRWTQHGNSSTPALLRPMSYILILGSGTPRQKRDLG